MAHKQNTIIINGRVYDTTTGKPLANEPATAASRPTAPAVTAPASRSHKIVVKTTSRTSEPAVKSTRTTTSQSHPAGHTHAKTERSKTLMRHVVAKPVAQKTGQKTIAVSGLVAQPAHVIAHDGQLARNRRAALVGKSHKINKFAAVQANVSLQTKPIPVRAAPTHQADHTTTDPFVSKHAPPIKVQRPRASHGSLFETALHGASNQLPTAIGAHKKHQRRVKAHGPLRAAGITLAAVLLAGGIWTYQYNGQKDLRTASAQVGFSVKAPSYQPAGYKLNKTASTAAQATLNYRSSIDQRSFTLTQQKAASDQVLAATYEPGNESTTQTIGGKTVYFYDNTSAAWVQDGVMYNLVDSAGLSRDQVARIISSL